MEEYVFFSIASSWVSIGVFYPPSLFGNHYERRSDDSRFSSPTTKTNRYRNSQTYFMSRFFLSLYSNWVTVRYTYRLVIRLGSWICSSFLFISFWGVITSETCGIHHIRQPCQSCLQLSSFTSVSLLGDSCGMSDRHISDNHVLLLCYSVPSRHLLQTYCIKEDTMLDQYNKSDSWEGKSRFSFATLLQSLLMTLSKKSVCLDYSCHDVMSGVNTWWAEEMKFVWLMSVAYAWSHSHCIVKFFLFQKVLILVIKSFWNIFWKLLKILKFLVT
jgi:hypothetical protein